MPLVAFSQNDIKKSEYNQEEVIEFSESKNRFSMGWSYYGRGN